MNILPGLLREKDEISKQLRRLNRQVEDLSLEELKNIISMKERLIKLDYEIGHIKNNLTGRVDAVGALKSDLMQNIEAKLSELKSQLSKVVHDDKNINDIMIWLDGLEKRLMKVTNYVNLIEDALSRQRTEKKVASDCSERDTEPVQAYLEGVKDNYGSEQHVKENQPKKWFSNKETVFTNSSLDSDVTCYKEESQPVSPVKEDKELKKLSKNIQNLISNKSRIGGMIKDATGIVVNQLPDNNEEVRKLQDFIKKQDKLQSEQPRIPNAIVDLVKISRDKVNRQKTGTLKEAIKPLKEEVNQHVKQIIANAVAEAAATHP